jgi:hypothetical protein
MEDFSSTRVRSELGWLRFSTTIMAMIVLMSIWLMLSNRRLLRTILTTETIKKPSLALIGTTFTTMVVGKWPSPLATGILFLPKLLAFLQFRTIAFLRFSRSTRSSSVPAQKTG